MPPVLLRQPCPLRFQWPDRLWSWEKRRKGRLGTMVTFADRDLHLVKKALAIAILAIDRQPGPFQSASDQHDMKTMLDALIESDEELAYYLRSARIAVTGQSD